jgi:prepilin-type N-terminal cleavage/methylation domain-containing protein
MLKSNKRKGFSLIEILCALTIITMLFSYIMHLELKSIRLKNYIEMKDKYVCLLETVTKELSYNCSYMELVDLCDTGKVYLAKENFNFQSLQEKNIKNCFSDFRKPVYRNKCY